MKTIEQKPAEWLQELEDKLANATHKQLAEWKEKYFEEEPAEWSDEDETGLTNTIIMLKEGASLHFNKKDIEKAVDWLRTLKDRILPQPKQEWKQENTGDLTDFENAMMHIGDSFFGQHAGLDPNDTSVVKEQAKLLLELVPKQEWSEEDENNILFLTSIIEECFKDKKKITLCGDTVCANFTKEDVIDRLKSLRPQSKWKPSEGQLECLGYAIEKAEKDWSPLTNNRIYLTLKALKEQLEKL